MKSISVVNAARGILCPIGDLGLSSFAFEFGEFGQVDRTAVPSAAVGLIFPAVFLWITDGFLVRLVSYVEVDRSE